MREVTVVEEQGMWMVRVVDGDRRQQFTCASQAQAESLAKVMGKAEEAPGRKAPAGGPRPR